MVSGLVKKAALRKARLKKYISSQKEFQMCGTCQTACESNYLCCSICEKAFHQKCAKLSKKKFIEYREKKSFICSNKCYFTILHFQSLDEIDVNCMYNGKGIDPCKKCGRDCLKDMPVIGCSYTDCLGWVHKPCSKLSEKDFAKKKYYFCSNSCEKKANLTKDKEKPSDLENLRRLVEETATSAESYRRAPKTPFTKVQNHLLDVKCSHINPSELDPSFLKNRKSELTIFQANIRSINANFNRFEDVFVNCNKLPDILTFTETWLHEDSNLPTIDGYSFESVNSKVTKNSAGGVGVFISNDIDYEIENSLSLNYKGCEDIWLKIKSHRKTDDNSEKKQFG